MRTRIRVIAGIFLNFLLCCHPLIRTLDNNLTLLSNAKYKSPDIQNESICIAASQIRENICREAVGAGLIATMVDDSKDIARKEQMSLCIRYTLSTSRSF